MPLVFWMFSHVIAFIQKLEEVGPVDNKPSPYQLHHFVNFFKDEKNIYIYIYILTCDSWHMTHDILWDEHSLKVSAP